MLVRRTHGDNSDKSKDLIDSPALNLRCHSPTRAKTGREEGFSPAGFRRAQLAILRDQAWGPEEWNTNSTDWADARGSDGDKLTVLVLRCTSSQTLLVSGFNSPTISQYDSRPAIRIMAARAKPGK